MEAAGGQDYTKKQSLRVFLEVHVESPGFGKAAALGSLSVPPSWPTADRAAEPASSPSLSSGAGKSRGRVFRQGLMDMMRGRRDRGEEPKARGDG
jgi:PPE family protein